MHPAGREDTVMAASLGPGLADRSMATLEPLVDTEYENDPVLPDAIEISLPVEVYVTGLFIAIPTAARLLDVDIESVHCVVL